MLQYLKYGYKQIKSYEISIIYIRYINWNSIVTLLKYIIHDMIGYIKTIILYDLYDDGLSMLQYLEYGYRQMKSYEISITYIRYINWNSIVTLLKYIIHDMSGYI